MKSEFTPSIIFIYFMIGFVIGLSGTMIILSLLRPHLPMDELWAQCLVVSPLILGGLSGWRVDHFGRTEQLYLSQAILRGLFGIKR